MENYSRDEKKQIFSSLNPKNRKFRNKFSKVSDTWCPLSVDDVAYIYFAIGVKFLEIYDPEYFF